QARRILGTEPRHCKAIPRRYPDLAGERIRCLAEALDERLIAGHDQSRPNRRADFGNRRSRELFADIAVEPDRFSEDQLAAAAPPARARDRPFRRPPWSPSGARRPPR